MGHMVIESPVAGVVCEQFCLLAERRAAQRPPECWVEHGRKLERSYHGHTLMVEPLMVEGRLLGWFKWLDQHYRGIEGDMVKAEHLLEQEATASVSAWTRKAAWVASGAPERRKAR